jgi:hypothetical protein
MHLVNWCGDLLFRHCGAYRRHVIGKLLDVLRGRMTTLTSVP